MQLRDNHVIDLKFQSTQNVQQLKDDDNKIMQLKAELDTLNNVLSTVKDEKHAVEEQHRKYIVVDRAQCLFYGFPPHSVNSFD